MSLPLPALIVSAPVDPTIISFALVPLELKVIVAMSSLFCVSCPMAAIYSLSTPRLLAPYANSASRLSPAANSFLL